MALPAAAGTYPRAEFVYVKGLRQVVVCPRIEPRNPIAYLRACRQNQDGDPIALLTQDSTYGETVDSRHHDVEHHRIERMLGDRGQSARTVGNRLNLVPVGFESCHYRFADRRIIIDD